MASFFSEDTVAFKADPSIVGTIESTWSDIDQDLSEGTDVCYVHKSLPNRIKNAWLQEGRLPPGYVIVQFLQSYDGYCLVSEGSLKLVDRSLAVGDVVKRNLSDAQSGTVISTSLMCELRPLCSEATYNSKVNVTAVGYTPSHGPRVQEKPRRGRFIHGFPQTSRNGSKNLIEEQFSSANPSLRVPAQELTHWHSYREEDFIIYRDWVGQIRSIYNEVTIRLKNGSVVVVEDSDELDEPYWIPDTPSYELVQRLDRAGYYRSGNITHVCDKVGSVPAEPCFPGQHVQTKKGNLRRGRWIFGAYDPSVSPEGIVVDVRCIELEIRWMYPNQSLPLLSQAHPPPDMLGSDEIGSGDITVYDQSRLPSNPAVDLLPGSSYSPDTGFGYRVRFKDPAEAKFKYNGTRIEPDILDQTSAVSPNSSVVKPLHFNLIPRAATQGFDMNVFQVVSISSRAMVRWQDCSLSEEDSFQMYPYLNPDEHDVWPGDKVSLKAAEEALSGNNAGSVRAHKVGVVQKVDAIERIARVRWFRDVKIDMEEERYWQIHGSTYGMLSDECAELPLYDIAAHEAITTNRGDLVIILPDTDQSHPIHGIRSAINSFFGFSPDTPVALTAAVDEVPPTITGSNPGSPPHELGIDWFGEVAEVCLDGGVVVRLGAAYEARDVKISPERILVVASDDTDSLDEGSDDDEDDDDDSYWGDEMEVSGPETDQDTESESAMDISYEYEGGEKINTDNDEEMWSTDEEDVVPSSPSIVDSRSHNSVGSLEFPATNTLQSSSTDKLVSYSKYHSMPEPFAVLDSAPPSEHHYFNTTRPLTAELMRRILKENEIMRSSLPDGVFVRSWDARLDLLRVLIVGPHGTPYEFAPFVIDLHYGVSFPTSSPDAFFHSWTDNVGRINPNLYENGRICLSLLGTWDGDNRNEEWSSKNSTVLQLIVSLMGLVLVKEPYYNEAGFDVLKGSPESRLPSALYNEKVYVMSKAFVKRALSKPPEGLEVVISWLYLAPPSEGPALLRRVVEDASRLLPEENAALGDQSENAGAEERPDAAMKLSTGALILLRRNLVWLKDYLR